MKTTYKIMLALVIFMVLAIAFHAIFILPQSADAARQALETFGN